MDTREIQSPEDGVETPTVLDGNSDSIHRKKLGMYFIESDDRRTAFGRGYTGGTTPVNIHGKPIPDLSKTGGWIAAFFIFGNEMAERMAYFGLSVNMVAYMFYVMHRPFSSSSNAVNNFLGISQASSVLGGFLADAYLGRYWTIAIFTTIYLAGLTGITLCATMSIFVPNQDNCDQFSLLLGNCEPAKQWQMVYLYAVLYVTAFGAAGIRPCVSSFGADQFDESRQDYKSLLDRFFNFFYLSVTIGAILAFTAVVYIQIKHGWGAAFGSLAAAMGISNMMFGQGSTAAERRWSQSKSLEALHCDSSRGSQDPFETYPHTSLHNNAQCNLNRVFDSLSTASLYSKHPHGSSKTPSNMHACISWPQHISYTISLLLHICPNIPTHNWSSPWSFTTSKNRHWSISFYPFCGMGWDF